MVFGEIVEPTSRALWEDDFIEYPEDEELELQWDESLKVPEVIDKLFIGESTRILVFLQQCLIQCASSLNKVISGGLTFYKIDVDCYMVIYTAQPDRIVGKITEKLIPWLEVAQNIYVLTSAPITSLQNCVLTDAASGIMKSLSTTKILSNYSTLEVPNLVTGLSASVMSLCIHKELTCTLYIGFFDEIPLDSINTQVLIDLLRYLGVKVLSPYVLKDEAPLNNLYI